MSDFTPLDGTISSNNPQQNTDNNCNGPYYHGGETYFFQFTAAGTPLVGAFAIKSPNGSSWTTIGSSFIDYSAKTNSSQFIFSSVDEYINGPVHLAYIAFSWTYFDAGLGQTLCVIDLWKFDFTTELFTQLIDAHAQVFPQPTLCSIQGTVVVRVDATNQHVYIFFNTGLVNAANALQYVTYIGGVESGATQLIAGDNTHFLTIQQAFVNAGSAFFLDASWRNATTATYTLYTLAVASIATFTPPTTRVSAQFLYFGLTSKPILVGTDFYFCSISSTYTVLIHKLSGAGALTTVDTGQIMATCTTTGGASTYGAMFQLFVLSSTIYAMWRGFNDPSGHPLFDSDYFYASFVAGTLGTVRRFTANTFGGGMGTSTNANAWNLMPMIVSTPGKLGLVIEDDPSFGLAFLIEAFNPAPPLTLACPVNNAGAVGAPYSGTLIASGGTPPYAFVVVGLPLGFAVDPATGVITGTPTVGGAFTYTAMVTDSAAQTATVTCQIIIPIIATGPGGRRPNPFIPNQFDNCLARDFRLYSAIDYERLGCAKLPPCFKMDEREWGLPL